MHARTHLEQLLQPDLHDGARLLGEEQAPAAGALNALLRAHQAPQLAVQHLPVQQGVGRRHPAALLLLVVVVLVLVLLRVSAGHHAVKGRLSVKFVCG